LPAAVRVRPKPIEKGLEIAGQNWLSNRIFECLDDIVDRCRTAWGHLADQPRTIKSNG
jgi:hypothetical protein